MMPLLRQLMQVGLSEKESRIYLAVLRHGPIGAQELAQEADVHRATTYLVIETLKERGLVSSFEQDKKTVVVAESPRNVLTLAEEEVRRADERRTSVVALLPELEAVTRGHMHRPTVRLYEGEEGLRSCREYLASVASERYDTFARLNATLQRVANTDVQKRLDIARNKKQFRVLYVAEAGAPLPVLDVPKTVAIHVRCTLPLSFEFGGELGILDTITYCFSLSSEPVACVIESPALSALFRAQFELAWAQAAVRASS
jgi:DNA-binding MarR family transcriptional regulator